jgi:hypothetical protein
MYDRVVEWEAFSVQVERHIVDYTLPQYGSDAGDEQVDEFTVEDCFVNMLRYINRRNANVRGDRERLRDLIKIAHYASFAYRKLRDGLEIGDVYPAYLKEFHANLGSVLGEK